MFDINMALMRSCNSLGSKARSLMSPEDFKEFEKVIEHEKLNAEIGILSDKLCELMGQEEFNTFAKSTARQSLRIAIQESETGSFKYYALSNFDRILDIADQLYEAMD